MTQRLCDVICVAPWTELDLKGEFEKREQDRGKKVINIVIMVQNR